MKNEIRQSQTQPTPYQDVIMVSSEIDQKIAQFSTLVGWLIKQGQLKNAVDNLTSEKKKELFTKLKVL